MKNRIIKVLGNRDIWLPFISALGALISAIFAGCKLVASNVELEIAPLNANAHSANVEASK